MNTARGALLCLFLFFIYGQQQVKSVEYHLADAIDDLNFFIPGSKAILTTAVKIWTVYGEVKQLIDPNSTALIEQHLQNITEALEEISAQLDQMSDKLDNISDDVHEIHDLITDEVLNNLPKELNLDTKLSQIYAKIHDINQLFTKFLRYNNNIKSYENHTLLNFANRVTDQSLKEMPSALSQIHHLLTERHSNANMLTLMANKRLAKSNMCKRHESAQQFINNLYNNVIITETKALLMTQFAYSLKNAFNLNSTSFVTELDDANKEFCNRTSNSFAAIKDAMLAAPRDYWSCDPDDHVEGLTYAKLDPVFQAYVTSEKDVGISKYFEPFTNKCADSCSDRSDFHDICRSAYCFKHNQKRCYGKLHNCKSSGKSLRMCLSDKNSTRRFEFIELTGKKTEFLGSKKSCGSNTQVKVSQTTLFLETCEYCFCICDDTNNEMDRYFSLRNVNSDVDKNMVVTGVRFAKENHIFHIQIQQGKLVENGNIKASTVEWKPVENFTIHDDSVVLNRDYHNITWANRLVYLDTFDSPLHHVLTGLRFQLQNGDLKLEIQVTPFNFYTAELKTNESTWMSNSIGAYGRGELDLENLDLGTNGHSNLLDSSENQYIKFTTSSMKTDVGQTVVPFMDLQDVTSSPPVPLSGAGLVHRGDKASAGFLSFKVLTYNYAPYLETDCIVPQ
ncbi:uncharacterized protein LOC100119678 [Nasonia vitripennis]|uniref:Uncharacterized protein n=1 Tax=Nasonia vitripennis TaxID=7425 RepID=A0A7M7G8F9_NASVI|nr:uncharacterized protein LOC100119678 [Nasonia vitripennis]